MFRSLAWTFLGPEEPDLSQQSPLRTKYPELFRDLKKIDVELQECNIPGVFPTPASERRAQQLADEKLEIVAKINQLEQDNGLSHANEDSVNASTKDTATETAKVGWKHGSQKTMIQSSNPRLEPQTQKTMPKHTEREAGSHIQLYKSAEEVVKGVAPNDEDTPMNHSASDGGFDGNTFSLTATGSQSRSLDDPFRAILLNSQSGDFSFQEDDERVKIAILDTGIDLTHVEWQHGRILRFGENGEHTRDDKEPRQWTRIRDFKNFCDPHNLRAAREVADLDGHGTQVAGIILRLAPRAEIYVARVCKGDMHRGTTTMGSRIPPKMDGISPGAVAKAVDWAIERGVHLINMSCGFANPHNEVEEALERAKAAKIVTFAAMSNHGNNLRGGAAWPARDSELTIGIHSCQDDYGTSSSRFTPPAVHKADNFMAVGENIMAPWPEMKGGGLRVVEGTSFSTPAATAMAALILAFFFQSTCKKQREGVKKDFKEDSLIRKTRKMSAVLLKASNKAGDYRYIHPELLWKDFDPLQTEGGDTPMKRRTHAWGVIRSALRN